MLCRKDVTIKKFLDDFKHQPALVMHWVIVGPSHQEHRPVEGGVLRAYRECSTKPSPVVKSIVNTFFLANMAANPHTFEYRFDFDLFFVDSVNCNGHLLHTLAISMCSTRSQT
jgi:hypothetical protein